MTAVNDPFGAIQKAVEDKVAAGVAQATEKIIRDIAVTNFDNVLFFQIRHQIMGG